MTDQREVEKKHRRELMNGSSTPLKSIKGRRRGAVAQLLFQHHEGEHCLGDHALERVKESRAAVEKKALAEETVEKHSDRHEWRREPQPAYQSTFANVEPVELAFHITCLADQPLPRRLPIVVDDPGADHCDGAVHLPNLGVPPIPHSKTTPVQQNRVRGIERGKKLMGENRIIKTNTIGANGRIRV